MRLVTFRKGGLVGVGVHVSAGVIPTRYRDMIDLLGDGERGLQHAAEVAELGEASAISPDRILAPIPRPQKIFASGPNFLKHLEEDPDAILSDEQFFFSKLPSSVIGPDEPIQILRDDLETDYEVELGIVIGRETRFVAPEDAMAAVVGYTVLHDVSSRWIQLKDEQITLGKGLDTYCPMGPALVTVDEIRDPHDLRMKMTLNGQVMQDETTAEMRFSIPEMVSYLSEIVTLVPGDVITGGSPDGIGLYRDPPVFLQAGDVVTASIEGVGELTNPVIRAPRQLSDRYFYRQAYD